MRIVLAGLALLTVSACQTVDVSPYGPHGGEGSATVRCRTDDRRLLKDCRVVSEMPRGQGFGEAAIQTVMRGRGGPDQKALPANSNFNVTVHFRMEDGRIVETLTD